MDWNDLDHHLGELVEGHWMSHPAIRARIDERVSGDPACWPTHWFRDQYADRLTLGRVLSIGCGTGGRGASGHPGQEVARESRNA